MFILQEIITTIPQLVLKQPAFRLARVDINANETFFFEPNYPIVLTHDESLVVEVTAPSTATGGAGVGNDNELSSSC